MNTYGFIVVLGAVVLILLAGASYDMARRELRKARFAYDKAVALLRRAEDNLAADRIVFHPNSKCFTEPIIPPEWETGGDPGLITPGVTGRTSSEHAQQRTDTVTWNEQWDAWLHGVGPAPGWLPFNETEIDDLEPGEVLRLNDSDPFDWAYRARPGVSLVRNPEDKTVLIQQVVRGNEAAIGVVYWQGDRDRLNKFRRYQCPSTLADIPGDRWHCTRFDGHDGPHTSHGTDWIDAQSDDLGVAQAAETGWRLTRQADPDVVTLERSQADLRQAQAALLELDRARRVLEGRLERQGNTIDGLRELSTRLTGEKDAAVQQAAKWERTARHRKVAIEVVQAQRNDAEQAHRAECVGHANTARELQAANARVNALLYGDQQDAVRQATRIADLERDLAAARAAIPTFEPGPVVDLTDAVAEREATIEQYRTTLAQTERDLAEAERVARLYKTDRDDSDGARLRLQKKVDEQAEQIADAQKLIGAAKTIVDGIASTVDWEAFNALVRRILGAAAAADTKEAIAAETDRLADELGVPLAETLDRPKRCKATRVYDRPNPGPGSTRVHLRCEANRGHDGEHHAVTSSGGSYRWSDL